LAVAVEDAGFEIRDSIAWLSNKTFPKSLNVSKAIDKGQGSNRERQLQFTSWMRSSGLEQKECARLIRPFAKNDETAAAMAQHYYSDKQQPAIATAEVFDAIRAGLPEVPEQIERLVAERTGIKWTDYVKRQVIGVREVPKGHAFASEKYGKETGTIKVEETASHNEEAKKWEGWGTSLKPCFEPIVMARKPLGGTVAQSVTKWGTGAINIDASRLGAEKRWPSNGCIDESVQEALGEPAKFFFVGKATKADRDEGLDNGNQHPTVKPTALMRYLVKLVTPSGGVVLDPFTGSGSTGKAAILEGFDFVGVELTEDYLPIIEGRLKWARDNVDDGALF
jgi:site-specific DNA-methyltransferase (adenine-specific)